MITIPQELFSHLTEMPTRTRTWNRHPYRRDLIFNLHCYTLNVSQFDGDFAMINHDMSWLVTMDFQMLSRKITTNHQMSPKITKCHGKSSWIVIFRDLSCDTPPGHFMTKHVVYHDISWHVMTNHEMTPSDSERYKGVSINYMQEVHKFMTMYMST